MTAKKHLGGIDTLVVTGIADNPSDDTGVLNKAQVLSIIAAQIALAFASRVFLKPVRLAINSNIDISNLNNGDSVDGVVVLTDDRILLYGQTTASQSGIYVVGATAGTSVRSNDMDTGADVSGAIFSCLEGTDGNTIFECTNDATVGIVATNNLTFGHPPASEVYLGTVKNYSANLTGDDTNPTFVINHALGTKDVVVSVRNTLDDSSLDMPWVANDINNITVNYGGTMPSSVTLRITVHGKPD